MQQHKEVLMLSNQRALISAYMFKGISNNYRFSPSIGLISLSGLESDRQPWLVSRNFRGALKPIQL